MVELSQEPISYEIALKLRDLEESQKLSKERLLLIGKNLIDSQEKNNSSIIEIKKNIQELKDDLKRIKSVIESLSEEVAKSARKEELAILSRQYKMFEPLNYARIEDIEKIVEEKCTIIQKKKNLKKTFGQEKLNMAVLDKVQQMKMQGYSNGEIIKSLEEEGVSPREINDALSQSSIKEAITGFGDQNLNGEYAGMEQSVMSQEQPPQETPKEFSQEAPQPGMEYNEDYAGGYSNPYAKEQYQTEYQEQAPSYGASPETMSEIANQVVDEKISKITKALSSLIELKTLLSSKVEKIDDRLTRIEKIIDQLQMSMIRKSSDNEQNIDDIKSELKEMQAGFSKIINPLVDKAREKSVRKRK